MKADVEKFRAKTAKEQDWTEWKSDFEAFIATKPKKIKTEEQKFAWLMHLGGHELREVYNNAAKVKEEKFPYAPKEYTNAIARLSSHYAGSSNIKVYMGQFRAMKQAEDESFDHFLVRLKECAGKCKYEEREEEEVIYQISQGARLGKVRDKAFEVDISLAKLVDFAHNQEVIESQKSRERPEEKTIAFIRPRGMASRKSCTRCGSWKHFAFDQRCPARKKNCNSCGRLGHFQKLCRSVQVAKTEKTERENNNIRQEGRKTIMQIGESDEYYQDEKNLHSDILFVNDLKKRGSGIITAELAGLKICFVIDSGSPINTITEKVWNVIKARDSHIWDIKNDCQREFNSYGSNEPLKVIAKFRAVLTVSEELKSFGEFFVIKNAKQCLISRETGEQLNVLRVGLPVNKIEEVTTDENEKFPIIPIRPVHIHIDEAIQPTKTIYTRIPIALRDKAIEKLKWMLRKDIVEEVNEPTCWISPMIVLSKPNGDVRIVIDMRKVNQSIKRINHVMPDLDTFRTKLHGCRIFSKIDVSNAYHHLLLDPQSRHLTTFMSPIGLLRYKRLMFGISCAPEIFQKVMDELFGDVEGIVIFMDDILIGAKEKSEHDKKLNEVLKRLRRWHFKLNEAKCEYEKAQIEFMGFVISEEGIQITEKKIEAVKQFRVPKSVEEVRSFMGLVTFVGHFIDDLSTKTKSLREMMKTEKFEWKEEQQRSFEKLKDEIATCTIKLGFFNVHAKTYLYTDASPWGLGAILAQKDGQQTRIITCIARSLTTTEQAYPQVQREALALIWSVKKLHFYLIGLNFTILTDNQALKFIFGNNTHLGKRACNRADAYALEIQSYTYKIEHIPGKQNIADVMSRLSEKVEDKDNEADLTYINNIMECSYAAITNERIKEELKRDKTLQNVMRALKDDDWSEELRHYKVIKQELYVWDEILWREDRIVLPESMRKEAMEIAHRGHPGIVSMKRMLRERVWWSQLDKDVAEYVKGCLGCTCVARTDPPEPLTMTVLPDEAWRNIAIDFFEVPELSLSLLVIVDYFSRYVMARQVKTKTAQEVIKQLEEIFQTFDYPRIIRADNGPPYNSKEFREYCDKVGIRLDHSIPLWAQSNGEIERQNQGIKKALRIAKIEKSNWKTALNEELDSYNKRPHAVTGVAPTELMLKRPIKNLLPMKRENYKSVVHDAVKEKDSIAKDKMKEYADQKRGAKESEIMIGDTVLMKSKKSGKLQPNFDPTAFTVVDKIGKKAKIQSKEGVTTERCSTELKKLYKQQKESEVAEEEKKEVHESRPKRDIKPNRKYMD